MDREKFREISQKLKGSRKEYSDYIEQFFTKTIDGHVIKEVTKVLNSEEREKIKKLRDNMEKAEKELDDFWNER